MTNEFLAFAPISTDATAAILDPATELLDEMMARVGVDALVAAFADPGLLALIDQPPAAIRGGCTARRVRRPGPAGPDRPAHRRDPRRPPRGRARDRRGVARRVRQGDRLLGTPGRSLHPRDRRGAHPAGRLDVRRLAHAPPGGGVHAVRRFLVTI